MTGIAVRQEQPGVAVLALAGEHDQYTAPRVDSELSRLLAGGSSVVVDLSATTFLDSTAVAHLVAAYDSARLADLGFALVISSSTGPSVHRLFELTQLGTRLPVASTLNEALERVRLHA